MEKDIRVFMMMSGEEIIGVVEEEHADFMIVSNYHMIAINPENQAPGLTKDGFMVDHDKSRKVYRHAIKFEATPDSKIRQDFETGICGLYVPPEKKIILG